MFDNKLFEKFEDFFKSSHQNSFELSEGKGIVMVSAPHSVEQTRLGKTKFAEPQSGALAKMLNLNVECPVIYKTSNCKDDANYDEISPYKDFMVDYVKKNNIKLVLDLHQLSAHRNIDINIGTGKMKNVKNESYLRIASQAFSKNDFGVHIDTPYEASYAFTVSSYVSSKCDITCLQIEINSKLLKSSFETCRVQEIYDILEKIRVECNSLT